MIVRVETPDRARIVRVGVDRDDERPETLRGRVDRAVVVEPAARIRAGNARIEKPQRAAARGAGGGGVEPGVDARIAEDEHVARRIRVVRAQLTDRFLERTGARGGIDDRPVRGSEERKEVDEHEGERGQ